MSSPTATRSRARVNPETVDDQHDDADVAVRSERHSSIRVSTAISTNPLANGIVRSARAARPSARQVAPTTNYDPTIVTGWGVRPYNWEAQLSIQQQVAPRVSVYAGYSRRWFGNLFATQNTAVTNASYTPYCIGVPTAAVSHRASRCRMRAASSAASSTSIRPTTASNLIQQAASNFGGVQDVYDGFDFDANARLGKGIARLGRRQLGPRAHQHLRSARTTSASRVGRRRQRSAIGTTVSHTDRRTATCIRRSSRT